MMSFQGIPGFLSGNAVEFGKNGRERDLRDDFLFIQILKQRGRWEVKREEEER